MKEYKNSNELLDYIMSKGVSVNNKEDALYKIKTYSYYSIINTYKDVVNISVDTAKEDELFAYVDYSRYYGVFKYNELDDDYEYNKNKEYDFGLSM